MRQLYHPPIENVTVESILHAFADPVRVRIFMELAGGQCTKNCTDFRRINKDELPKSTLSQHFRVLREAGLIYSERKGVEMHNRSRCDELKERYGDMVGAIMAAYVAQQKGQKTPARKRR